MKAGRLAGYGGGFSRVRKVSRAMAAGVVLCGILMAVSCGGKNAYYKSGADQAAFDRDSKACREHADAAANAALVDKKGLSANIAPEYYQVQCLYQLGWSEIPPGEQKRLLWRREGSRLTFGRLGIELPPGFVAQEEKQWVYGPTWCHQILTQNSDTKTYLALLAQEDRTNSFKIIRYPQERDLAYYTGGRLSELHSAWSVFTGRYMEEPIVMLGSYIFSGKKQRITVVFTRTLDTAGMPLPDHSISLEQRAEVERIYPSWVSWLKAQTGGKDVEERMHLWDMIYIPPFYP